MKGGGSSPCRIPLRDVAWSWLGAFVGLLLVSLLVKYIYLGITSELVLIGSFGASAVLIYGAPAADFSQPRNLVGGHIVSAIIGVSISQYLPFNVPLLAALAVSTAIAAMHLTRTVHPPGGATALIAVIGGTEVHNLGYGFVVLPVGVGVFIMLLVALVVNNMSVNPLRHYPKYWY